MENKQELLDVSNIELPKELTPLFKGVSEESKKLIKKSFSEVFSKINEWKEIVYDINVFSEEDEDAMQKAKEAGKILLKARTGSDKVRKELKAESTAYGKAVQGVYNWIESEIRPLESHCEEQAKFKEIQAQLRRGELRDERVDDLDDLIKYIPTSVDLGVITDDEYSFYKQAALSSLAADLKAKEEEDELAKKQAKEEEDRVKEQAKLVEENRKLRDLASEKVNKVFSVAVKEEDTDEEILSKLQSKLKLIELPSVKSDNAEDKINALVRAIENLTN